MSVGAEGVPLGCLSLGGVCVLASRSTPSVSDSHPCAPWRVPLGTPQVVHQVQEQEPHVERKGQVLFRFRVQGSGLMVQGSETTRLANTHAAK